MSNIRRIKRQMATQIINTGTVFNGCPVLLANGTVEKVKQFQGFLATLNKRARCPNLHDMYIAHFALLSRIEAGDARLLN